MSKIEEPVSIFNDNGKPVGFGWACAPWFIYNKELLLAPRRRISEADRYIISSPTHLFIFDVADNGYLGYINICLLSLRDRKKFLNTFPSLFPLGSFMMPDTVENGSVRLRKKRLIVEFIAMKSGARIVKVDVPHFDRHRTLRGEVVLIPFPQAESIATVMPWRRDNAFRYSFRAPHFSVEGVMQIGTTEITFTKGNAWGVFDRVRAVRPSADIRYWATACGTSGGKQAGFSIGYDSADSRQGTENAFFLDGKLHKLDQVTFHISPTNWLLPWRFTSNNNRIEMVFTPEVGWEENHRILFYYTMRRHFYGSFAGKVILDNGDPFEFKITGFAERRRTRF
ncbi:MAG: DUF2804 domain-containing protein [Treponema sp.]|jgi:hypothetical protein|nr:DUF2804 domain-containing protein [Treponema sp.]